MRTKIEVGNLTQGQFDWLKENIPGARDIPEGTPRMCVVFVGPGDNLDGHVELPPREFVAVIELLARITRTAELLAEAPGAGIDGDPCQHGAPVVEETPSMFENSGPVRTYADGCQSYGPYGKVFDR